jgi:hypothetical protein
MKGWSSGWEIGVVAVAVIGGAMLVLPKVVRPRGSYTPTNTCIANLKQIQGALEMFGMENKLDATNRVSPSDISGGTNMFIRPLINVNFVCPSGGAYSITTVEEPPRCSVPGHTL